MMTVTTIAFLVENKPGVLFNVANMFRRRGFNIDSISVGALVEPDLARMTVVVDADARILNQIVEQLSKMVEAETRHIQHLYSDIGITHSHLS